MRFAVIPSEARNPSSIRMPRKERFLTPTKRTGRKTRASQTPFGMTNSRFFSKLLGVFRRSPQYSGKKVGTALD
jgi:hypothetical protein